MPLPGLSGSAMQVEHLQRLKLQDHLAHPIPQDYWKKIAVLKPASDYRASIRSSPGHPPNCYKSSYDQVSLDS